MSVFTERGANSSSMNLMNSATRLPDGAGMQKPRTGKVLSADFSAADGDKVAASSQQSHDRFNFRFMFSISAFQKSASSLASRCADQLRAGRLDGFIRVFSADDFAHEFRPEPGVLVREFDSNRLAVDHGQLMAQLVADVAVVVDLVHGPREIAIVLVRFAGDGSVDAVHTGDAAVGIAVELPAKVRHDLHGADRLRGLAHRGGALIRHQGSVQADFQMR